MDILSQGQEFMLPPIFTVRSTDITQPEYEANLVLSNDDVMLITFSGWYLVTRHLRFLLVPVNVEMPRHDTAIAYLSTKPKVSVLSIP